MYYVVYGILWLISLLPLPILYFLSDGIFFLVFHVFKYRKNVVMSNLQQAFPEKTEEERLRIAKKFYLNLVDTFIETIKMISVSEKYLLRRFDGNWEAINQFYEQGKSVQVHLGHNFNWEWGNAVLAKKTPFRLLVVYMPIVNKIFNKLFYKLRTRGGTELIAATNMRNEFLPFRGKQYLLALVADQNPGYPDSHNAWWINFLNKPTPFLKGPEKGARANKTAVVFAHIIKPARGYYRAVIHVATEDVSSLDESELTRRYVHYLTETIQQQPEMWLWSHRRWKWNWKPEFGKILE
jgi:KDO2-lipid IV(A) lauroyltransferase